jgi:hypothetical protein
VEEMAVAPGNKGELSGKGDYFTAAAGRTWVRVPVVDTIVVEAYNSVNVAYSKDTGNVAARDDAVKMLRVHKAISADLKEALTESEWCRGMDS